MCNTPKEKAGSPSLGEFIALFSIISFFAINCLTWLSLEKRPPLPDPAYYLKITLQLYNQARAVALSPSFFNACTHPPLLNIAALPLVFLLGFSVPVAVSVNFLYLAVLVFSVYGIGRILFDGRAGIQAGLLLCFYPIVYALCREYWMDFPLLALICLSHYLILKSGGRPSLGWCIAIGLSIAWAGLTKESALLFTMPAAIYLFFRRNPLYRAAAAVLLISGVVLLCLLPWHLSHLRVNLQVLKFTAFGSGLVNKQGSVWASLVWYWLVIKSVLMSPLLWNLFMAGISSLMVFASKNKREAIVFLAMTCLPGFVFYLFFPSKDARYIMPVLPAAAVLTAAGINALPVRLLKGLLWLLAFTCAYITFNNLSFNLPPFLVRKTNDSMYHYNRAPSNEDWKIGEILLWMHSLSGQRKPVVGLLAETRYFHANTFGLYAQMLDAPCEIVSLDTREDSLGALKACDFLILKAPETSEYHREKLERLRREFLSYNEEAREFIPAYTVNLPDSSQATIYRRE